MHSNGKMRLLKVGVLRLGATTRFVFILASVIDMEVAKIKTSFLALDSYWYNSTFSDN